jgi:hypothetical protein
MKVNGGWRVTHAMINDPDLTEEERTVLDAVRRNSGCIRNAGPQAMLEILAAVVELTKKGER